METTFSIYFKDLTPEAQEEALRVFGYKDPKEGNWDLFPITTVYIYKSDDGEQVL